MFPTPPPRPSHDSAVSEPSARASGPRRVSVIDTTLRDGEQAHGVCFTADQRLELAAALSRLGVDEIEVGTPAMGRLQQASIAEIVDSGLACRLTGWCRAKSDDLKAAWRTGLDAVHLGVPGSDIQLGAFGRDLPWVEASLIDLVARARDRFAYVSVGVMDASRCTCERLDWLVRLVRDLGADRLRLADTVGVWTPAEVMRTVTRVRAVSGGMAIGIHTHNDLGMATGNAIAALQAGADSVDVTVGGLGERAGNAALEQVAAAAALSPDLVTGLDTTQLVPLCNRVASWLGIVHPNDRPILGGQAFVHESGIHTRGMLRDPRAFEPCDPALFGHRPGSGTAAHRIMLGTHSGRAGLAYLIESQGIRLDADCLDQTLRRVRLAALRGGGRVDAATAVSIYQDVARTTTEPVKDQEAPVCAA